MGKKIRMYDGMVFGEKVSGYGIKNGYLDYRTLAKIVGDMVLNNYIHEAMGYENWELDSGEDYYIDEEFEEVIYYEIYQEYIISEAGYKILAAYTDEIVYYNEEIDMYLWGITHFGTSWDYVLTDVKLVNERF